MFMQGAMQTNRRISICLSKGMCLNGFDDNREATLASNNAHDRSVKHGHKNLRVRV